jgi:hypothetical protein
MRTIGIILIVLGILGFIVDNISFTTDEEVADIGPVEVEQQNERTIPIAPLAAGGAIVVGAGLVIVDAHSQSGS